MTRWINLFAMCSWIHHNNPTRHDDNKTFVMIIVAKMYKKHNCSSLAQLKKIRVHVVSTSSAKTYKFYMKTPYAGDAPTAALS